MITQKDIWLSLWNVSAVSQQLSSSSDVFIIFFFTFSSAWALSLEITHAPIKLLCSCCVYGFILLSFNGAYSNVEISHAMCTFIYVCFSLLLFFKSFHKMRNIKMKTYNSLETNRSSIHWLPPPMDLSHLCNPILFLIVDFELCANNRTDGSCTDGCTCWD